MKMDFELKNKALGILSLTDIPITVTFFGKYFSIFLLFTAGLIAFFPIFVILLSLGVAEVDQQPVAKRSSDKAVPRFERFAARLLVGVDDLAEFLRIELP